MANIPPYLIHEIMDEKLLYRQGFMDVVSKKKAFDDIRGIGMIQSRVIGYFLRQFYSKLDQRGFVIGSNVGLEIDSRNHFVLDIAIFSKAVLTGEMVTKQYPKVPPILVIEIDTDIEFEDMNSSTYINIKTQKLLDFGAEKVVWCFTVSKKSAGRKARGRLDNLRLEQGH